MTTLTLKQARAHIKLCDVEIMKQQTAEAEALAAVDRANEELNKVRHQARMLADKRAAAQRDLYLAEDAELERINVETAAQVLKLHAADPIANQPTINRHLEWLAKAVRIGIDAPLGYKQNPIIAHAMKLQPELSDIDRPMFALGGIVDGKTDWISRRRQLIEEIERDARQVA